MLKPLPWLPSTSASTAMADDLSPAILAQCRIIEDHHDRTIDYAHLGALRRQVQQSHDLILTTWKQETAYAAKHADTVHRAELRILWLLINDEQQLRKQGTRRFNTQRAQESIRQRAARVHDSVNIRHFLERECGVTFRGNRCRCPIHDGDSDSSFSLWREGNGATCFVCHFKGDVIELAQQYWHLGRPVEAIRRLERWG